MILFLNALTKLSGINFRNPARTIKSILKSLRITSRSSKEKNPSFLPTLYTGIEKFLAISNAGQYNLSPTTALTSIKFLSAGESSTARRFEPRPETKTASANTLPLNYFGKTT